MIQSFSGRGPDRTPWNSEVLTNADCFRALGVYFFFPSDFLMLIHVLLYIQLVIYILRDMETSGKVQRRERAQTTCVWFGPR